MEERKSDVPRTKSEARQAGSKLYFTGTPCIRGHIDNRRVDNGTCVQCQRERSLAAYHASPETTQAWRKKNLDRVRENERQYRKEYREKHLTRVRERVSDWQKNNPEKVRDLRAQRRAAQLNRTPPWVDRAAIGQVYVKAQRLSEKTGIQYHVDHIMPLRGRLVSGLHVPWNLRPLEASENRKKSNIL